jgi:hypothetical protein
LLANGEDALEMEEEDQFEDAVEFNHVESTIEAHNPIEQDQADVTGLGVVLENQSLGETNHAMVVDPPEEVKEEQTKSNGITTHSCGSRRNSRRSKGSADRSMVAQALKTPLKASPNFRNSKNSTSPSIALGQSTSPTLSQKTRRISREPMIAVTPTSPEEEESLRIAMELQAMEFGLRARRSG